MSMNIGSPEEDGSESPMTQSPSNWPPQLDALIAAGDHHRSLLENESVRVLETCIEPGETVPLHTHRWPAVYYVLSVSDFVRRDERGDVVLDTRDSETKLQVGQALWGSALGPHTLENVGSEPLRMISVEVKGAPAP